MNLTPDQWAVVEGIELKGLRDHHVIRDEGLKVKLSTKISYKYFKNINQEFGLATNRQISNKRFETIAFQFLERKYNLNTVFK